MIGGDWLETTEGVFWLRVSDAVVMVRDGVASRVDGEGFKVYRIPGDIVRIDIPKEDQSGSRKHQDGARQGHKADSAVRS
jgi:hypothetical protein